MKPPSRRERFVAEVAAAARKRPRPRRQSEAQLDNLARARKADPLRGLRAAALAPRCSATNRAGGPCRAMAMRGTDRCHAHGGRMRAGPEHPGNVRALLSGRLHRGLKMQEVRRQGREAWRRLSSEEVRLAMAMLPEGAGSFERAEAALAVLTARSDARAWAAWVARQGAQQGAR